MPRKAVAQPRIRSDFVRARVAEIACHTGMTETAIIEDARRAYVPPAADQPVPPGLVQRGDLLVQPARKGRRITRAQANAAIEAARNRGL